jgi:hypothetical protein
LSSRTSLTFLIIQSRLEALLEDVSAIERDRRLVMPVLSKSTIAKLAVKAMHLNAFGMAQVQLASP